MHTIGWLGSLFLAICGLPQAWLSYKQGHSDGISTSLLVLWGAGEILTLFYVTEKFDWPLIFNYGMNLFSLGVIAWYKLYPRKPNAR